MMKRTRYPNQDELLEPKLLELLRSGSRSAGDELCRRLEGTVRLAVSKTMSCTDPDFADACQATLEQVVRTVADGRFEGRCSVQSWARAIARNVSHFAVRARLRERELVATTATGELPEPGFVANRKEEAAIARCDLERLLRCLSGMRQERANVLWLHHALGYDLSAIARRLGISAAAAQSRLVRGRRDLQLRIEVGWEERSG